MTRKGDCKLEQWLITKQNEKEVRKKRYIGRQKEKEREKERVRGKKFDYCKVGEIESE